jgi:hypothetical protein
MIGNFGSNSRQSSSRSTKRANHGRNKARFLFDDLEPRTLLTATLSVTGGGAAAFLSQTAGSSVGLAYNTGSDTYIFTDSEGIAPGTVSPAFTYTQVTGTEATLAPVDPGTQDFTSLAFDQNIQNITYNITALAEPTTFADTSLTSPVGTPLTDSFDFGATGLAQSLITAPVSVALTKEFAAITVDDSNDAAAQTIDVSATQVDFDSTPAFIYSTSTKVSSVTVLGGTGGNTIDVNGTVATGPTTVDTGTGADTVNAFASSDATLNINGQAGADTVTLGALAGIGMANLLGNVTVTNAAGTTALTLDDSQDMGVPGETATITDNGTTGTEQGLSPGTVTYTNSGLSALTINGGTAGNSFDVTGVPPTVPTTLNAGAGNDVVKVVGASLVAGTNFSDFTIDGATGTNTLVVNSTGTTASFATNGVVAFGNGRSFGYTNFNAIQLNNTAPIVSISPVSPLISAEGGTLANVVIATFTDADLVENATSYTATVNWGDGSTASAGAIAFTGTSTVGGVTVNDYNITGTHSYLADGTFTTSVILDDLGGTFNSVAGGIPVTLNPLAPISGTGATVNVNALTAGTLPTAPTATAGILLPPTPLVTFTDAPSPLAPTAYIASINWGDGSPIGAGAVSFASGVFTVSGSHDYTNITGTPYTITVAIVGDGQQLTETTTANVVITTLNGKLSPMSDSGLSNTDGVTNITTPTFVGNTSPGTSVEVFAAPSGSATLPGSLIATGTANAGGVWTATAYTPLANGSYVNTAEVLSASGSVLATTSLGTVVIDNVGPVVTALTFDRFTDTVTVTYQDNLSGLDYASIANSNFYQMSATQLASDVPVPKLLLPTSISITPGATPTSPEVVQVVFNKGRTVRGGRYLIVIDSGTGDTGVQDIAGNPLDGNFYGNFPSGDGIPGGDFVVAISTFHAGITLPYVPLKDGYVPPSAAVDPPAHTPTGPVKKPAKATESQRTIAAHAARQARLVDRALHALSLEKNRDRRRV